MSIDDLTLPKTNGNSLYRVALAGRAHLNHFSPRKSIGTAEKQVFSQIFDTLVTIGPNLDLQPSLAQFAFDSESGTLSLNLEKRLFHDLSPVTAEEALECIKASAHKFLTSFPRSAKWFGSLAKKVNETTIAIEFVDANEAETILRLLALSDFGIHKLTDPTNPDSMAIGTGPYKICEIEQSCITLRPFEEHPQSNRTIDVLQFLGVPSSEQAPRVLDGSLDEYMYFGNPNHPMCPKDSIRLPSHRANVGLLLLNPRCTTFEDINSRRDFASRFYTSICQGYFDDTWALPQGIIPPGFPGHGAANYLQLGSTQDRTKRLLKPTKSVTIAVVNDRQKERILKTLNNPNFRDWKIEILQFPGMDSLKQSIRTSPTVIDIAFLAIRSDRADIGEFFEFLDSRHPTALIPGTAEGCETAYSAFIESNPDDRIFQAAQLESKLIETMLCLPLGYYYDVRIVSPHAKSVVGLKVQNGLPRYLHVAPCEILQEVHNTHAAIHNFWKSHVNGMVEQTLHQAIARTAHDLKSPVSALKVLARTSALDDEPRALLEGALHRINQIIHSNLKHHQTPSDSPKKEMETVRPGHLLREAIQEISHFSPSGLRFQLTAENPEFFDMKVEIARCDLASILTNLIKNSAEALHASAYGKIEVSIRNTSPLTIEIRDNGPGLTADSISMIGKRQFTTKDQGTGLGLMQATHALRRAGGDLHVSNGAEGGACAVLKIPSSHNAIGWKHD